MMTGREGGAHPGEECEIEMRGERKCVHDTRR